MKVLIADDEESLVNFLYRGLCVEGFECTKELQLHNVETHARREQPDVIILDRMFNDEDSINIIERLKRLPHSPMVLLLTALDDVIEKIAGLDKGADDYLCKPFSFDELLARCRALLRRTQSYKTQTLKVADLEVDTTTRTVRRAGKEITLSGKEYALLEYLIRNKGVIISETKIVEHVWDMSYDPMTNVVNVYIHHLRKKIDTGFDQKLLHTVRNSGYVIREE